MKNKEEEIGVKQDAAKRILFLIEAISLRWMGQGDPPKELLSLIDEAKALGAKDIEELRAMANGECL